MSTNIQEVVANPALLSKPLTPTELTAEEVVALRSGDVLLRYTILKSDHFPGCQNTRLTPLLDGAPNFRQVEGLPVYGVAIPTVSGLRTVLDLLGAAKGRRKVLWFNLREEPVLYINGRPFVVREADKPFANLEYTGIDRERVEDMETRLKLDVLNEAAIYGGSVMVAHEDDSFQVIEDWEAVTEVDVQTPAEVYTELAKDGYDVEYLRVPITDEKAPKGDDFECIISRCWSPPEGSALMFNCQMGRGRTTTGMTIGCLLHLRRVQGVLAPPPPRPRENLPAWYSLASKNQGQKDAAQNSGSNTTTPQSPRDLEMELKTGGYAVIRSLLRALENGRAAKKALDVVLDACAAMQNLREAIAGYRTRLFYEVNEIRRQSLLQVCLEYLERYYVLVEFAAYIDHPDFNPSDSTSHVTFASWRDARPELKGILERLIRSNPLSALSLDKDATQLTAQSGNNSSSTLYAKGDTSTMEEEDQQEYVLAHRDGSVLGPHTILKQDHFPGCQSSRLPAVIPGAPNFRSVPGDSIRVFGGGIATVDGIRKVLEEVGSGPNGNSRAVWHMMREEPVVFIEGQPYVLREESRPFKNLLEYRGIDAQRLDQMEQRLKNDVVAEAVKEGGRILVTLETSTPFQNNNNKNKTTNPLHHRDTAIDGETFAENGGHTLRQEYIPVSGSKSVATPAQVFEELQTEGYRVKFLRVPLTDGTCPRPVDFDAFYDSAASSGPTDALIYTCQLGGGRTTTGMAIGTLLRIHLTGANLPATSDIERLATFDRLDEDVGGESPRGGSDDEDEEYDQTSLRYLDKARAVGRGSLEAATAAAIAAVERSTVKEDLDPETKNLQDGEYVGMRRFTRTLERGAEAKAEVDAVVDACGIIINLRTSIMRYRKPKSLGKFFRPEIQARHNAFQRGSAYLERYCMLVAFSVYLTQSKLKNTGITFSEWISTRPDVVAAREALHQNPAGALAPIPVVVPLLTPSNSNSVPTPFVPRTAGKNVSFDEQRKVLLRRKGSTIGRRSILKSFTMASSAENTKNNVLEQPYQNVLNPIPGVTDYRKADNNLPIYTVGNSSVQGLRALLNSLGAGPGGPSHLVITDLREELVLYINGVAYLRRELEMPAAALHHAGIQAAKLEDLERRLRADMMAESSIWGGKVLLHREVQKPDARDRKKLNFDLIESNLEINTDNKDHENDDITKTTEYQPTTEVTAFWELTGDIGDVDLGMCTPSEVFVGLAAEGYHISYKRVPLSRERTPQAADLNQLHQQMNNHPGDKQAAYLFVSRTATGSSARFAAAFACTVQKALATAALLAHDGAVGSVPSQFPRGDFTSIYGISPSGNNPINQVMSSSYSSGAESPGASLMYDGLSPVTKRHRSSLNLQRNDSDVSDLVRSTEAGEYRGVMNLCRVLPGGAEAKAAVDEAIDACWSIGNLREDILKCKHAAEDEMTGIADPAAASAARRLGLHYLQRYFLLIAFRVFFDSVIAKSGGVSVAPVAFSEWVGQRREITYLLSNLELE